MSPAFTCATLLIEACKCAYSDLQDVEVPLVVLPKGVLAPSEAEEGQHAVAEDIGSIALACIASTSRDELLWSLPPAAAPYKRQLTWMEMLCMEMKKTETTVYMKCL